ncbi:hypothetical protein CLV47_12613 [Antricoccus suffuscus]|uniref:DUF4386 family protein n=1 Tax=Antricoccus suffuscus TaxID=1629062 RepID=A0A2T0Z8T1_9ACTN|nr:hypothetical protein [Antricoccus suffuscus]PRZ32740.1 hypothetical protein CLV47_12613 [Antricoccus suffuscus]
MSLQRMAPLTGLLGLGGIFAGLWTMDSPGGEMTDPQLHQWFATHSMLHWMLSAIGFGLGGIFLLIFTAVLVARQEIVGAGAVGRHLTLVAGTAWGILTVAAAAMFAAVPSAQMFMGPQAPNGDTFRLGGGLFYGTLTLFCAFAAALLAVTLSITSLRTGLLPRSLAWIGIPAAVLMLTNVFLPMAIITLWYGAVCIALTVRKSPTPPPAARVDGAVPVAA